MRTIFGLCATALALGACGSGGLGNEGAMQNTANAAAPATANAARPEAPPQFALDQQRLVEACIPPAERERPINRLSPARRAALNTCLNTETVRQLSARLPVRIDSSTQLDQVTVEGSALVYRYRVSQRLAALSAGTADRIEAHTRRNACAGEDVQQIVALGGVQVYRWVDRNAAVIREVRITAC